MIVIEALVLLVGVACMVWLHSRHLASLTGFLEGRVEAQDEAMQGRENALYKQRKAIGREHARNETTAASILEDARHLHEETRLAHQRTDALARDLKEGSA